MKSLAVLAIFVLIIGTQLIQFTLCKVLGALYFMLNEPSQNPLIVNSIDSDGSLKYVSSIENPGARGTGGLGELHSSNSLVSGDNFIFCVNAASDTVSFFRVEPANASNVAFKDSISSGGKFPNALAYSSQKSTLCVANGGSRRGVLCFEVNKDFELITISSGKFTPFLIPAKPLPNLHGYGSPSDITLIENDTYVAVLWRGIPLGDNNPIAPNPPSKTFGAAGFILTYKLEFGRTPIETYYINNAGPFPSGMTVLNPSKGKGKGGLGDYVAYVDAGTGRVYMTKFKSGKTDRNDYVLSSKIPHQQYLRSSAISPKNGHYYAIDSKDITQNGVVTELSFDLNKKPTQLKVVSTLNVRSKSLLDPRIVSLPGGDYLYMLRVDDEESGKSGIIPVKVDAPGRMVLLPAYKPTINGEPFPASSSGLAFLLE